MNQYANQRLPDWKAEALTTTPPIDAPTAPLLLRLMSHLSRQSEVHDPLRIAPQLQIEIVEAVVREDELVVDLAVCGLRGISTKKSRTFIA